ncbi:MAG: tyrosine-type recombinase/integrase [Candidatus Aenigmarchaeota archaeon]|nr:tyrosine-type recombinase/integrase [Candidatus Aenigmarchaeota archaeon]
MAKSHSSAPRKLPRDLTEEEVHRMFQKAEELGNLRDLKILKLLYYFGLRNNEMCSLGREHISLIKMVLKVEQGKGEKDRLIPVIEINPLPGEHRTIVDDLGEWIGSNTTGVLIEGDSATGTISDRHVRRIVKNYAAWAKVPKWEEIHPHTLRHSYATHLLNLGVPVAVIQRLLGHSKIDTTMIYAHMGVENLRTEIKKHVWIARSKKEISGIIDAIKNEQDPNKKLQMQNDLIIKGVMVMLGITPEKH